MQEKIWFLKDCDLFGQLSSEEKRRLELHAVLRTFPAGSFIYFPTDPGQSVLVLTRGRVKIKFISPEGQESILAFIGAGELFGELAIVDAQPRNEYAEAVADTTVVAIPRAEMLALMEGRPEIALHVTRLFGFRRRRIENRLRNILFCSIRQRVVALLLELVDTHGLPVGDAWEISLPLSHQDLASLIGATRETVTLTLGHLQAERLIRVQRRRLTVLDRQRLAIEASAELGHIDAAVTQKTNSIRPNSGDKHG
jgi:CRP-like cAMP-binding protein